VDKGRRSGARRCLSADGWPSLHRDCQADSNTLGNLAKGYGNGDLSGDRRGRVHDPSKRADDLLRR